MRNEERGSVRPKPEGEEIGTEIWSGRGVSRVAPRRQPVPELAEVARKVGLELSIDCPSTPAAPWLGF
jgi:hypothetical protein